MRTFPALAALVAVAAIGFTVIERHVESRTAVSAAGAPEGLVECACPAPSHDAIDELGDLLLPMPGTAEAAPTRAVTLTSLDAGSTQTFQLTAKRCYCAQPTTDATCIRFLLWDGGSQAADCTKDMYLDSSTYSTNSMAPGIPNRGRLFCFDSSQETAVVAMQADGGSANVNVFLMDTNPVSSMYQCSTQLRDRAN